MKILLPLLFLAMTFSLGISKAQAADAGFQFILVTTFQKADTIIMNDDIDGREFKTTDMTCKASLESKIDPIYPDQKLGTLKLTCLHGKFPIETSVSCSLMDSAAQNHFEFGEGDQKYAFDLLCKAKPLSK